MRSVAVSRNGSVHSNPLSPPSELTQLNIKMHRHSIFRSLAYPSQREGPEYRMSSQRKPSSRNLQTRATQEALASSLPRSRSTTTVWATVNDVPRSQGQDRCSAKAPLQGVRHSSSHHMHTDVLSRGPLMKHQGVDSYLIQASSNRPSPSTNKTG